MQKTPWGESRSAPRPGILWVAGEKCTPIMGSMVDSWILGLIKSKLFVICVWIVHTRERPQVLLSYDEKRAVAVYIYIYIYTFVAISENIPHY